MYLGFAKGLHFSQFGDTFYIWALGAWRFYCKLVDWLGSVAGRLLRVAFVAGRWITVRAT
jgi:hypothetical protein